MATLALRYVCSNPDVTVVIPGMAEVHELDENIKACSNTEPLTEEELAKMDKIREQLGNDFCRRCNYCAPCTVGINIPSVFLFAGYLQRYDLADWAKDRYRTLSVKASACIECGKCEPRCPYHLPIREKLKTVCKGYGRMNMFKDIVKASRSYRGYDESYHFIKEELEDFVDCARLCTVQRECTAVPLLSGMGERRSFTASRN